MTSEANHNAVLLPQAQALHATSSPMTVELGQTNMVKVTVPSGAVAGQQINFTLPTGVRVSAVVQENIQPGDMLTVAVPSQQPGVQAQVMQPAPRSIGTAPVPPTPYVALEEVDRQASFRDWVLFALSFPLCCVNPTCGFLAWVGLALNYFCKPREERQRRPQQWAPACAAASTAGACCVCAILMSIVFFVGVIVYCGATTDMSDPKNMQICSMQMQNITTDDGRFALGFQHGHLRAEPLRFVAGDSAEPSLELLTRGQHPEMPVTEAAEDSSKPHPGKPFKILDFLKLRKGNIHMEHF
mmetsp:Transcript_736/g.1316  ORF Transcript_736/g.1316 Transcript_736/m.1316 type:complete len:299 (+) Transcript_736:94-990(+)